MKDLMGNPFFNMGLGILASNRYGDNWGQALGQGGLLGLRNTSIQQENMRRAQILQAQQQQAAAQAAALSNAGFNPNMPDWYNKAQMPQSPSLPTGMRKNPDGTWAYDPAYLQGQKDLRTAGADQVDIHLGAKLPQGYQWKDPSQPRAGVEPIKGGPEDTTQQQQNTTSAAFYKKELLSDLIGIAKDQAGFWTTGFVGNMASNVAGTPAHDLAKTLDTIRANIGFDKLQEMRANSPTGGALGQVSERENALLQAVWGALEQSQSKGQFIANLGRVERQVQQSWKRIADAYEKDFGEKLDFEAMNADLDTDPLGIR